MHMLLLRMRGVDPLADAALPFHQQQCFQTNSAIQQCEDVYLLFAGAFITSTKFY